MSKMVEHSMPGTSGAGQDRSAPERQAARLAAVGVLLALLFTVLNVAAAALAWRDAERAHTLLHVALAFAGGYLVWWLRPENDDAERS